MTLRLRTDQRIVHSLHRGSDQLSYTSRLSSEAVVTSDCSTYLGWPSRRVVSLSFLVRSSTSKPKVCTKGRVHVDGGRGATM